ncbi:MAG: DUF1080 domain-containing protein [Planctomycetaceae bacterium]
MLTLCTGSEFSQPPGRPRPLAIRHWFCVVGLIAAVIPGGRCLAQSEESTAPRNQLTAAEKDQGWILLFNGSDLTGWKSSSCEPSRRPVEDGSLNPHKCGGYMLVYQEPVDNFQLALDFRLSPNCNTGIFFRTHSLKPHPGKDVGFNGLEVAIDDTETAGYHDTGAIYDLVKPSRNAMKRAGEWNHLVLTCDGPRVEVELNGERVTTMNLADWTQPNRRPDGSEHKFDIAYAQHPRQGFLGLQDHGSDCWYRNVKLRKLPASR